MINVKSKARHNEIKRSTSDSSLFFLLQNVGIFALAKVLISLVYPAMAVPDTTINAKTTHQP